MDRVAKEMGRRIREQRIRLKLTQKTLAELTGWTQASDDAGVAVGLSPSRIGNYEQGTRRIGHEEAELLSKLFGPPVAYFLVTVDEHEAQVLLVMRKKDKNKPRSKRRAS